MTAMSEGAANVNSYMETELGRLRKEIAETNAEAKQRRLAARAATKQVEELTAELVAVKTANQKQVDALTAELNTIKTAAEASPDQRDATIKELNGKLRVRDIKDQWSATAAELKPGYTLEKLWRDIEFDPTADGAEKVNIKELVAKGREVAGYGFKESAGENAEPAGGSREPTNGEAKSALSLAALTGQGAPDTHGTPRRLKASQTFQDPGYMMKHGEELKKAIAEGRVVVENA